MIEVFKTDVIDRRQADRLIDQIHTIQSAYSATFDLEDCDKILRIKSTNGIVDACVIIRILRDFGFNAEVLADDDHVISQPFF
ncbi:hypothetical protein GCM10028803_23140 [Larkinella knui]|uniref:Copper chaperone n=1 Tax=Larkinella knui TaxID=2025310 RepID=A0A3P1CVP1_9BACT|nr:hypothetical protein [Larkinella knui]RRB17385.1 hypothetical protein EHT87_03615 [Larkinella knui]